MATRKSSKKTNEKEIEKVKGTIVDDNGKEIDMDSIILTPAEYFEKICSKKRVIKNFRKFWNLLYRRWKNSKY